MIPNFVREYMLTFKSKHLGISMAQLYPQVNMVMLWRGVGEVMDKVHRGSMTH